MENNRAPTPNPNRVSRIDYAEYFPKGARVTSPSEDDGAQARVSTVPFPPLNRRKSLKLDYYPRSNS
jgi:hypothetical protein